MAKDYYNILGVGKSASQDDIKKAFRKLAHEHHPDKKTGDEVKFKEINEAYQVLGNADKRKQYDQYGQTFSGAGSSGGGGFGGRGGNPFGQGFGGFNQGFQQGNVNFDFGDLGDMGDLFGSFFGGGRPTHNAGRDLETEITIEFLESVFGVEKTIDLNKKIKCEHCSGSGAEPGAKINTCKTCNGSGRAVKIHQTILGRMQMQGVCDDCSGEGKIPEKKCSKCSGAGHVSGRDKIGWKFFDKSFVVDTKYNKKNDITFFKTIPDIFITLKKGDFVIFFPEDAHSPLCGNFPVRKCVFKIPAKLI